MKIEEFREIPNFSRYGISKDGVVKNITTGCIIKPYKTEKGYLRLSITSDSGKATQWRVHRLVALTYIDCNLNSDKVINHINGIKIDNRVENLEIVTSRENTHHAIETGLWDGVMGENNSSAKLTNKHARCIRDWSWVLTAKEMAVIFGVHPGTISAVIKRKSFTKI